MNLIELDLPMSDYRNRPGLSKSALDYFLESPLVYQQWLKGELYRKTSHDMVFGTCGHSAILESRQDYYVRPETYESKDGPKPWTNAANFCKEWTSEHSDKPVLSLSEHNWICQAFDLVHSNAQAQELLVDAKKEVSAFAMDTRHCLQLKGRFDAYNANLGYIVDLKTTLSAHPRRFSSQIANFNWDIQAAMYRRLLELNGADFKGFWFIAVEKSDVPRISVRLLDNESIDHATLLLDKALTDLTECQETGVWPGYDQPDVINMISTPAWRKSVGSFDTLTIGGEAVQL